MSILSLYFPFLLFLTSGLIGRKLGLKGVYFLMLIIMSLLLLSNFFLFYEVFFDSNPLTLFFTHWIQIDQFLLNFSFFFDDLAVTMLIVINSVSLVVLIYSYDYMINDPHLIRFFTYIFLFVFSMIILISNSSLPFIFIGWEGEPYMPQMIINSISFNFIHNKRNFYSLGKGISSLKRIGPHNKDIISFLLGSILGDTHLEKRIEGLGTRIIFEQCDQNVEYMYWFYNYLYLRGYCSSNKPKLRIRIKKNNKRFFHYRLNSYTFASLNWLHILFYKNNIKIIPQNTDIWDLFTPFSLAIWFMDDGSKTKSGYRLATNNFSLNDIEFLCNLLFNKFNLITSIQLTGLNKGYIIYIKSNSKNTFTSLIFPYIHPCMKYKLHLK